MSGVFPLEIDAGVKINLPVFSDIMVSFEEISKVVGMADAYIFNTKVVNDESEEDRALSVALKNRSVGARVVSVLF